MAGRKPLPCLKETHEPLTFAVAASNAFEGRPVDVYQASDGTVWLSREQIGRALGYSEPRNAIAKIHERHAERLDAESTVVKVTIVEGSRTVERGIMVYSPKGIYEICRWSQQLAADAFFDLEALRKTDIELRRLVARSISADIARVAEATSRQR